MKTVNSVSGGQTSAYIAKNYKADYNLFALVRIEDENCRFKDETLRKKVEDRIQAPFIGTAEMDEIIYTMFDLEQYIGQEITWVTGITFEEIVRNKGGWLPNKLHRYCTSWLKINPMFHWWHRTIGQPVEMRLGYRANETNRALRMQDKLNKDGILEFEVTFEKHTEGKHRGKNKWEMVPWQKPIYPLITDGIYKSDIQNFWKGKPVRFAEKNNCVGCFHRHPILLRRMWESHPNKMQWFANQEGLNPEGQEEGTWRTEGSYEDFKKWKLQLELGFEEFGECDSGMCGI